MTTTTALATPPPADLPPHGVTAPAAAPGAGLSGGRQARPPGRLRRRLELAGSQAGMTTAEYAVGTVAACGFGGVLYKVITNDRVLSAIGDLIAKALTLTF